MYTQNSSLTRIARITFCRCFLFHFTGTWAASPHLRQSETARGLVQRQGLVHRRHVQTLQKALQPTTDHKCVRQKWLLCKADSALVCDNVRKEEKRLQSSAESRAAVAANITIRKANHSRLRKSCVECYPKTYANSDYPGLLLSLDTSPMEKGMLN